MLPRGGAGFHYVKGAGEMTGQERDALDSLRQDFWEFRESVAGQLGTVNGKLNTLLDMYQKDHNQQPAGDGGTKVATKALGVVEKIVTALIGAIAGVVGGYYAGKG